MNNSEIVSSWVEVSAAALDHNVSQYKSVIGNAKLAVVIKSNAYGCGLKLVAKHLDTNRQVDYLCVFSLSEAVLLRTFGIQKAILVLGILDCDLAQVVQHEVELTVFDLKTALELNRLGSLHQKKIKIHVKIDTGLSRLGLIANQALGFIPEILKLKFVELVGIFTHYTASDRADFGSMHEQLAIFNSLLDSLAQHQIDIAIKHTANTAAATADLSTCFNMVRIGIGLYGMWPSWDNQLITQAQYPNFNLRPVLSWKTKVFTLKELAAGSYVGYDQAYQTTKFTKIAILPVGYYEGYDRRLSNKGHVMIHNQSAPVIGNIAMNMVAIDVTNLEVAVGDEVILIGDYAGVRADDLAQICMTANTEITARINPLVTRKLVF